jgi:hypothetical protein
MIINFETGEVMKPVTAIECILCEKEFLPVSGEEVCKNCKEKVNKPDKFNRIFLEV